MDSFNVIITEKALQQLEAYVDYIQCKLKNIQAAQSVWQDAIDTRKQLELAAGNLRTCSNPKLRRLGYHSIPFLRHKYTMIYRITGHDVYVDAIYHQLQDYEKLFTQDINI